MHRCSQLQTVGVSMEGNAIGRVRPTVRFNSRLLYQLTADLDLSARVWVSAITRLALKVKVRGQG